MSAYQLYLALQKEASGLSLAQGLWKGTVAGAVPGAVAGAYAGKEKNPDNPAAGMLTGAVVGGLVGGVAGRGAQYATRVHRVAKELKPGATNAAVHGTTGAAAQGAAKPSWRDRTLDTVSRYTNAAMIEREIASSAGKEGFSAAAKNFVQSGKAEGAIQRAAKDLAGQTQVVAKSPRADYWADAKSFASATAGSALAGGTAEAAFGDKNKSFGERFREGAIHGAAGGAVVGGSNLAMKHLARRFKDKHEAVRTVANLYDSKFYRDREGSPTNSFIVGAKKGLGIGLGFDTISGMGSPTKKPEPPQQPKQAANQFLHLMSKRANMLASAVNAARLPVPNPLKAIKPVTAPTKPPSLPKPPGLPKIDPAVPGQ